MPNPTFFNRFLLLVLSLLIVASCFSQHKTIIGLNLTGERNSSSDNILGFGGTFEKQFSKHSSIETGLYYRTFNQHWQIFVDGSLYDAYTIKEQYLSVPILYKFYSSVLNFSAGPTFDIYTGSKQVDGRIFYSNNSHSVDSKFHFGLLGKLSKSIGITKRLFAEPELRYNTIFYKRRHYYGLGIAAKYSL